MLVINNKQTLVIAHRGESGYFPENTMRAFKAAEASGADMIELDVTLSKDYVPVVIHDDTLNRTTNGNGLVREKTFRELQNLDAGSWFSEEFSGEHIPSLEEVCAWLQTNQLKVNIEIKSSAHDQNDSLNSIESQVVRLVTGYGIEERTMISSFSRNILQRVRQKDENVPLALLWESTRENWKEVIELIKSIEGISLNLAKELIPTEIFYQAKQIYPILAYTVNHLEDMKRMLEAGVNGIFTNYPRELKQILKKSFIT